MNPSAQSIDPALKETYDKVMATQLPVQPSSQPKIVEPSPSPVPVMPQPSETPKTATAKTSQVYVSSPTSAVAGKQGKKISPVILGVVGIVFFAIYAVVWLKVFGVI